MPHPQDVAVPSLPRELNDMLSSELAQHVENYARAAVIADRAAGRASAEPEGFVPLTDAQIEKLREETFSTNNPFCPVDSKSMRKAVRAAERAHRLAAAPTPTASIAPKAEGETVAWVDFRNLASARVSRERGGPFDAHVWSESKTPIHDTPLYTAPSKELTHDQALALWGLGDMPFGDFCERVGRILGAPIASPVAQAAAGALSDEQCATQLALMKTPPMKDGAALHDWACDVMRAGYRLARPEADADRASGGGV